MRLFGRSKKTIERKTATGRFAIRSESLTADDVWELLTEMFKGKVRCIVLQLDRLIPVTGGEVKNGSRFEDYNAAGPRRPLTVTTWDPENRILAFRIQVPDTIEEKYKDNAWEYQFIVNDKDSSGAIVVDAQVVIEHSNKTDMDAVRTLKLDISHICGVIGYSRAKFEREEVRAGLS